MRRKYFSGCAAYEVGEGGSWRDGGLNGRTPGRTGQRVDRPPLSALIHWFTSLFSTLDRRTDPFLKLKKRI